GRRAGGRGWRRVGRRGVGRRVWTPPCIPPIANGDPLPHPKRAFPGANPPPNPPGTATGVNPPVDAIVPPLAKEPPVAAARDDAAVLTLAAPLPCVDVPPRFAPADVFAPPMLNGRFA